MHHRNATRLGMATQRGPAHFTGETQVAGVDVNLGDAFYDVGENQEIAVDQWRDPDGTVHLEVAIRDVPAPD